MDVIDAPPVYDTPKGRADLMQAPEVKLALGRTYSRAPGAPLEMFLRDKEVIDNTGATDMSWLGQRAYNEVNRSYGPVPIYWGPGIYRMDSPINMTPNRRDVGLVAAGSSQTKFVLGADCFALASGYGDSTTGKKFEKLLMKGFSIDCSNQVATPTQSKKGLNIGHIFDSLFEDIEIYDSWATSFGIDFLVNVYINNCGATNAGRGVNKESLLGFGSAFGIGTGAYENESMYLTNIRSRNSGRMGINLEWLHEYGQFFSTQIFVDNWHSYGDAVGVGDLGNGGLHLTNSLIEYFTAAGVVIGPGGQAPVGGSNGLIDRSVVIRNGKKTAANRPDQDIYGAHGVVLRGEGAGGYRILPTIQDNEGAAIYVEPGFRKSKGSLVLAPHAYRNKKAIDWRAGGKQDSSVVIANGHYEDNGIGIDARTSLLAPRITDNTFVSNGGKQPTSIRFDPNMLVDRPVIKNNVSYDVVDFIVGSTAMLGQILADNPVVTTPATSPGLLYFSPLTSFPDVDGLGDGWLAANAGVFTQTHTWTRGRYGAEPKDGGTGNSGASLRYRDVGTTGYIVSAIIDPVSVDAGRRGIVASYNEQTGDCMVFENYSSYYQWVRYNGTTRTVIRTIGEVPFTERHEISIVQSATTNTWVILMDGEVMFTQSTSTIGKTSFAGVFALAQLDGWISNFAVRAYAG